MVQHHCGLQATKGHEKVVGTLLAARANPDLHNRVRMYLQLSMRN